MFERLKTFLDSFLDKGLPGFDFALYKDGECCLRYMNGYSDVENRRKISGKERYHIYSCTKPITCTAALQLWEKGLYSFEDKLSDYMPEFQEVNVQTTEGIKKAKKPILIKHLFEMTAGFSYSDFSTEQMSKCRKDTEGRCPTHETIKYLARNPLHFEPGERWEYGICHDVLAALVEVVSGEKFEEYVKIHIFDIMGMVDSVFFLNQIEADSLAPQYRFVDGKLVNMGKQNPMVVGSEYASGGAGCISTVDDYIKFLEGLRKGVLLKSETVQIMQTNRLNEHQMHTFTQSDMYGYGLGVRCQKDGGRFTDFGWAGAAGAYLAVDTRNGISMYLASHLHNSPVQKCLLYIYPLVYAELFDESEFEGIYKNLKERELLSYSLTY